MIGWVRRRLGIKLFLTYLIVILTGVVVLVTTSRLVIPSAFQNHLSAMSAAMSSQAGQGVVEMERDLFLSFQAGVIEALSWSAAAAFLAALVLGWFVSRQVVIPVRALMDASQRIAEGQYQERVQVPGSVRRDELDELALLALSFNQMADRLHRTETMRRQLIGDVAHELRTPLTIIKGSMEGLIDGVLPADTSTYQQVYKEADRLQRLAADLQELSRVETGPVDFDIHPLAVDSVMKSALDRFQQAFQTKGINLTLEPLPEALYVMADPDRLQQILTNLLGNALRYTPADGNVWVGARRQKQQVVFVVGDTGIGIAAEHLPHIFNRFYRVDRSRARDSGGSGIGLTIARRLVEAQDGRIWVESSGVGKGSRFFFTLPAEPGLSESRPKPLQNL